MPRPKLPRDEQGNIIREKTPIDSPVSAPTTFDKPEDVFVITLSLGSDIYSVSAPTIFEALSQIHPTTFGKSFATIQIEYKNKTTKLPLKIMPIRLREIFNKPYSLQNFAKRLTTLI